MGMAVRRQHGHLGRIFQTLDEVRDAARAFTARDNAEWLVEKNRHFSPYAMRQRAG